ncbi:hypothetical protein [Ruegeria sp. HKCCA5763]
MEGATARTAARSFTTNTAALNAPNSGSGRPK